MADVKESVSAHVSDGEEEVEKLAIQYGGEATPTARAPRKFLIALDLIADSMNESYSAFDYVACIVRAQDEIVVVSSYGTAAAANCDSCDISRKDKVYKRLQRLKRHAKTNTKCQNVTAIISSHDPPGEMICRQAETHRPTFVVVGARSQTAVARAVFGSCSQYVVHHTAYPVIVVNDPPLGAETLPNGTKKTVVNFRVPGNTLALYDGSNPSKNAIQKAITELVVKDDEGIDVLMVKKKPSKTADKYQALGDEEAEDAELAWAQSIGSQTRNGVKVHTMVKYGDARELIEDTTEDPAKKYTTLVMGARGRGTMKRLVLGSVSDYCLRHVKVPAILIVKS